MVEKKKKKTKRAVEESMVVCCKVFISEARNTEALEAIERAAAREADEAVIVSKFDDRHYNRVRYTVVSYVDFFAGGAVYSPLQRAVMAMAEAAYAAVDLREHSGAHPRLGVLDDVVFHPLTRSSLHHASLLAEATARQIAASFQGPFTSLICFWRSPEYILSITPRNLLISTRGVCFVSY